jgi:murein DD-endopeptidase MepM/ murein hydrolase activator NlpD
VLIEHDGGFSTVYAHLDPGSVSLRRKTAVQQGQRLGTMGVYGGFPAPWLHFELRYENTGSVAASVLDPVQVSGRRMRDYRAGDGLDFLDAPPLPSGQVAAADARSVRPHTGVTAASSSMTSLE